MKIKLILITVAMTGVFVACGGRTEPESTLPLVSENIPEDNNEDVNIEPGGGEQEQVQRQPIDLPEAALDALTVFETNIQSANAIVDARPEIEPIVREEPGEDEIIIDLINEEEFLAVIEDLNTAYEGLVEAIELMIEELQVAESYEEVNDWIENFNLFHSFVVLTLDLLVEMVEFIPEEYAVQFDTFSAAISILDESMTEFEAVLSSVTP